MCHHKSTIQYIANHWNPPVVFSPQNDKVFTVYLYVTTVYSDKGIVQNCSILNSTEAYISYRNSFGVTTDTKTDVGETLYWK